MGNNSPLGRQDNRRGLIHLRCLGRIQRDKELALHPLQGSSDLEGKECMKLQHKMYQQGKTSIRLHYQDQPRLHKSLRDTLEGQCPCDRRGQWDKVQEKKFQGHSNIQQDIAGNQSIAWHQ